MKNNSLRNNNKGVAMIIVVCIMAISITLSLSLLASASVMYASSNNVAYEAQSQAYALSLSKKIEKEIVAAYTSKTQEEQAQGDVTNRKGYIWSTLRDSVDKNSDWPYYSEELLGHQKTDNGVVRTYSIDVPDDRKNSMGNAKIEMFWECSDFDKMQDCEVTVNVTCSCGDCSSTITSIYSLSINTIKNGGNSYEQWKWNLFSRE